MLFMRSIVLGILLVFPAVSFADVPAQLFTPASAYEFAWKDAKQLEKSGHDLRYYRWLSSYNCTNAAQLKTDYILAAFVSNSLNFVGQRRIAPVSLYGGRLFRIDLKALYIEPSAWDTLGREGSGIAPFPEPYFHASIETPIYYERAIPGSQHYVGGRVQWMWEKYVKETKVTLATAEHVAPHYAEELFHLTGSQFPVYRTDWFCNYAMQSPAYERFQGNPKDFDAILKLAGVDRKAFDRTAVLLRGAILRSEVTYRNRIVERIPTDRNYGDGYLYNTLDYFTSIRRNDVIANLLQRKRDAGEVIWSLPNGLQGYSLVAAEGDVEKVIGFADANKAALDNRTKRQIKVVMSGMSCVHCHAKGAIPVADEARLTSTVEPGDLAKIGVSDKDHERVGDVYYGADINGRFFRDQAAYAAAIKALCGKDSAAVSLAFEDMLFRYQDAPLGVDEVAIEMGYPKETVLSLVGEVSRVSGLDHSFVRLLKNRQARRDQFEVAFPQLQRLLIRVP